MRTVLIAIVACVLAVARGSEASFSMLEFSELVFGSQAIVIGRIERLRETDYDFRVEERIAGAPDGETLCVQRFKDWSCAARDPAYAEGQRFLSFLSRDKDGWRTRGAGCEGDVFLEGGKALVWMMPSAVWDTRKDLSESRLVAVLRALRSGYREVGAPGYVEAWRGLLTHADPIVVAGALEKLDGEIDVNPHPASAFADEIVGAVANADRGVRLYAAVRLRPWLGRSERDAAAKRFGEWSKSGRPEQRPAAAVARMELDPADAAGHTALILLLADESIPLAERDAAAAAVTSYEAPDLADVPLAKVDPVAREAVATIRDPSLLLHLCAYLAATRNDFEYPKPTDAEAQRAKWLKVLESPPPAAAPAPAPVAARDEDAFLTPEERAVFVPRDAKNRPLLARMVRTVRRAHNARKAGDAHAALDSYRDFCSALSAIDSAQRKVLLGLGVHVEEVAGEARALDASLSK
jgi:hypothetical protein